MPLLDTPAEIGGLSHGLKHRGQIGHIIPITGGADTRASRVDTNRLNFNVVCLLTLALRARSLIVGAKNLLFVTHYTGIGGGEMVLLNLAQHLDRARYTPHLLVPGDGQVAERWRALGGPVHIIPFRGATEYFIPAIWARFPIVGKIEALIREQRIDALHTDYHSLPMALPAAVLAGIPTIWTCMGWWTRPKPWQYALFRRPTATMALDEAVRDGYVGQPPCMPPEEITLVFPGVDTSKFHPGVDGTRVRFQAGIAQDAPVVALVARFQQVKGHEVFQAMARQVAL